MRIAAGVLLIIVAVINLIAGGGYLLGGAVASGVGEASSQTATEASEQQDAEKAKTAGTTLKAFGGFLFLVTGLQIAGAVMLFKRKARMFVLVTAILTLAAEAGGIGLLRFGVLNVPGIVAGIFALLGARAIRGAERPRQAPALA